MKSPTRRSAGWTALLAVPLLLLAACAPNAGGGEEPGGSTELSDSVEALEPRETVKIAYVPIMHFATSYVADTEGLFDKYGIDVEFERVSSGTDAIAFLSSGAVDVGAIAFVASTFNGWYNGDDFRIFAPAGTEPLEPTSPSMIVVSKALYDSGEVTEIADLEGRVVGVAGGPGSGGEYITSKFLETADLTIRDVELQNVPNPDMPAALEAGTLAAAQMGSPYAQQAIDAGIAVELMNVSEVSPGLMVTGFVGSGAFINDRPEVAKRFVLALAEAAALMQGDDYASDANIEAYLAHVDSTPEAIKSGVPMRYDTALEISIDSVRDAEAVHRGNGRTEYQDEFDVTTVIDTRFVDFAANLLKG